MRNGNSWTEQAKLVASDGAADDFFGTSVAINGNTIIVGAYSDDIGSSIFQGSAYVFVRSGSSWTEQAKLVASDGGSDDFFGKSVAIHQDTIVVGAYADDISSEDQGSAYVYVRSGGIWSEQQKLIASNATEHNLFGNAVSIIGDTIVVGSPFTPQQGSAYVFVRSSGVWTEQQILIASDGEDSDLFGNVVSISGDTIVVAAEQDRVGSNWAQGSVYVFVRSGSSWTEQAKLVASDGMPNDRFGCSVAVSGDTIVVGAYQHDVGSNSLQGSAYVFTQSGNSWTQAQELAATDGAAGDLFGSAVAISGSSIAVGSPRDDLGTSSYDFGSVCVFATWSQKQKLMADEKSAGDYLGSSVAISGNTIVVGAYRDDIGSNSDQGSAYVFTRSGNTWTQEAKLIASDGTTADFFGISVAIFEDTIVAGAYSDDVGLNSNQGSAYVFERSGKSWTEQAKLVASDGAATDFFGLSVSISGDLVVVGAPYDDIGANANQGSVYVFARVGSSWKEQSKITSKSAAASDFFGYSVAINGETIVVGAYRDDIGSNSEQGSAYVFTPGGSSWVQQTKLLASDGAASDYFGHSVTIFGDTIAVGAYGDDIGSEAEPVFFSGPSTDQGSVYVFVRSGTSWAKQTKLVASDGAASDNFGRSVAIYEDRIVVGAPYDDTGASQDRGSAYMFARSGNSWLQARKLTASDGAAGDRFGHSTAIYEETTVVGAPYDDGFFGQDQGSVYVFSRP
jgi:hypothetical protein